MIRFTVMHFQAAASHHWGRQFAFEHGGSQARVIAQVPLQGRANMLAYDKIHEA